MELSKNWLQRFAMEHPDLNTQLTTSGGLTAETKTFYDTELIEMAEPELVHDQFGQEKPIPQGVGNTIEFRRYASLPKALTPLTEGVTPKGQDLNVSAMNFSVKQYGGYVTTSDILDLTAIDDNVLEATRLLGSQAGRTLDTITREVLAAGKNVYYVPTRAEDGTETPITTRAEIDETHLLSVKDVFRAAAILKAANAPKINGDYVAIIHPYVAHDLMMEAGAMWREAHKYATPENIYNGEIGKLGGVRFVESTEAKVFADTTDSCAEGKVAAVTLFLGANAYGTTKITGGGLETIVKPLGSAGTADPLNQRASVGWKATKTAGILVDEYILRVESGTYWNAQLLAAVKKERGEE